MEPQIDIQTIIASAAVVQAFFLAVILLSVEQIRSTANRVLSFLLMSFSACIGLSILYHTRYILIYPHLSGIVVPVKFLLSPLLYLYVKTLLKRDIVLKNSWLHFLPSVILLLVMIPHFLSDRLAKVAFLEQSYTSLSLPVYFVNGLVILQVIFYLVLIYECIREADISIREFLFGFENKLVGWMRYIVAGFIISVLLYYLVLYQNQSAEAHYVLGSSLAVFIFVAGYIGLKQEQVFSFQTVIPLAGKQRSRKSGLKATEVNEYRKRLIRLMEEDKLYLEESLSLQRLANELSISTNHMSELLNNHLKSSFFDFINSYRVEHAKNMLVDPKYRNFTILSIAYESGFSSKSSFYLVFKKYTGLTPGQYKNMHT